MAVVKLTPEQLAGLRTRPKLNKFWEGYFQEITVELNKLMFSLFRKHTLVKPVNLEIVKITDYLSHQENSIIQFFKIYPHNSIGFYALPYETVDLLMNQLLGGRVVTSTKRDITRVDESVIQVVTSRLAKVLEEPLVRGNRKLSFEFINLDHRLVGGNYNGSGDYICVQQYVIQIENQYFYFDLAFTNNFLNRFSLV
jgi:hypothetical protein